MVNDSLQPVPDIVLRERWKSEAGAAGLDGWDDLADIVADEAEASVPGVLLDNCAATQMCEQ